MLTLQIITLVVLGAILGLFLYRLWTHTDIPSPTVDWMGPVAELETRIGQLEMRWVTVREELVNHLETGNVVWRKIRQREAYASRRLEEEEGYEEETVVPAGHDPHQTELLPAPSPPDIDPRGLGYQPRESEQPWQAVAREIARQAAQGGN